MWLGAKTSPTFPSTARSSVQNRLFVGDLARQIALLATEERTEGVFHLGTSDSSEEETVAQVAAQPELAKWRRWQ